MSNVFSMQVVVNASTEEADQISYIPDLKGDSPFS